MTIWLSFIAQSQEIISSCQGCHKPLVQQFHAMDDKHANGNCQRVSFPSSWYCHKHWKTLNLLKIFLTMTCVKWKQPCLISFSSWMSPKPSAPFDKNSLGGGRRILSINYPVLPRHKACNDRKLLLWPRLFLDSEPHASTDLSCDLRGIKRIFDIVSTKKSGICACRKLLDRWQQPSPIDSIETWWNMIKPWQVLSQKKLWFYTLAAVLVLGHVLVLFAELSPCNVVDSASSGSVLLYRNDKSDIHLHTSILLCCGTNMARIGLGREAPAWQNQGTESFGHVVHHVWGPPHTSP